MKAPVIALQGIGGVYNYGCEAIVRGTEKILRRQWPGCKILYVTSSLESDAKALADLNLTVLNDRVRVPFFARLVNKGFRLSGLPFRFKVKEYYPWLKEVDVLLSIGGDLLTLGPRDVKRWDFPLGEHLRYVEASGTPVVLWGASVGPFDTNARARRVYSRALKGMKLIVLREEVSRKYLQQLGVTENVVCAADPAYMMTADDSHADEDRRFLQNGPLLAVNFSPLSALFAAGGQGTSGISDGQADFLRRMLVKHDGDILLVPHVICPGCPSDDDYAYLKNIHERLPETVQSRVRLLPPDLGARRTKWIVSQCKALVASRMHCAVAGFSTGVPTLLLSYSQKAFGMCDYVYGHRRWLMPVGSGADEMAERAMELLSNAAEVQRYLKGRQTELAEQSLEAGALLKKVLT